jgi:hypothetical protein
MEQKGRGGGKREGRRQPGPRTSGKLLVLGAKTSEIEEGGSKRPTLLPSLGGGVGLLGCGTREKTREPWSPSFPFHSLLNQFICFFLSFIFFSPVFSLSKSFIIFLEVKIAFIIT